VVTACFDFFAAAADADEASIRVIAATIDRAPARNRVLDQPHGKVCEYVMSDRLLV
jgi:hypothetical protein